MKQLILFLLLLPGFAVAQPDAEKVRMMQQQVETMRQQTDSLSAVLQRQDNEILASRTRLMQLLEEVEANKRLSLEQIALLREQNELLRQMQNYVKQIDELNTLNLQLERELEECRGKSTPKKEK